MVNRSDPPGTMVPEVAFGDVARAAQWLCATFGFRERLRAGDVGGSGPIHLGIGQGGLVLVPGEGPGGPLAFAVRVRDVDEHWRRAVELGARVLREPETDPRGERRYAVLDLEGNRWTFTQSVADVPPEAWGALGGDVWSQLADLPKPSFCYLQIPARDVDASVAFYEGVFGWNIRGRGGAHPSFDDAAGRISGAWVVGWPPAREPGLLPSIWVDAIDATLERVVQHGGAVVEAPHKDAPDPGAQWIARFRDVAGNVLGLYQEGER